jgi:hypothetical protein
MARTFDHLVAQLWCLHWPGERLPLTTVHALRSSGVFLDTCLRQLAFGVVPGARLASGARGEFSTGKAAYRLLLEVACGLRSAVPGETNVTGQFRRACDQAEAALGREDWQRLHPLVHALLADARALRASHLQGLAGSSYGSLVRELMEPRRDARVLFVGTGDLARSMLPLFRTFEVGAWNHRPTAPLKDVGRWFRTDEADTAAAWATDFVFTTPADPEHDTAWHDRLHSRAVVAPRALVHLGQRRGTGPAWPSVTASFGLDDVFALAGAREQLRSQKLAAAAAACTALVEARLNNDSLALARA